MKLRRVPCQKLQLDVRTGNEGDDMKDRIRAINKNLSKYKVQYHRSLPPCDAAGQGPKHFMVFENPWTDEILTKSWDTCESVFKAVKGKRWKNNPVVGGDNSVQFIFDNMTVSNVKNFVKKSSLKSFGVVLDDYLSKVISVMKVDSMNDFENRAKFVLVRYAESKGLHMHVDNVRRSGGAIVSMHVGPDHGQYILGSLDKNKKSETVVLTTRKGDISVMQGDARFDWAHGLPFGFPFAPKTVRYTFLLLIGKQAVKPCGSYKSDFWKMTLSKYVCPKKE